MGNAMTFLTRPIRSFNIENRSHRVISRAKPIPAPQYPATERQKKVVDELYPNFLEDHNKKNLNLDDRLKDVYVVSDDPQSQETTSSSSPLKPLPQVKYTVQEFEFGFFEPGLVPEGKCTLRQALTFMVKHKENPQEYSVNKIALEYKMDEQVVENILRHYKLPQRTDLKPKMEALDP